VTLFIVDVVGFTTASMYAKPTDIMVTLGSLFRNLDQLHAVTGAVKIETVGDQYVSVLGAAGPGGALGKGAPPTAAAQAVAAATLALDVIDAARTHWWPSGAPVEVRVGMHAGPATTGVVGGALPRWGVFGRTVVIASRMESSGAAGRVHVSAYCAALLSSGPRAADFLLAPRVVDVKGVGTMETAWVARARA
jgi:class 3 adenylate cyclase